MKQDMPTHLTDLLDTLEGMQRRGVVVATLGKISSKLPRPDRVRAMEVKARLEELESMGFVTIAGNRKCRFCTKTIVLNSMP